MHARHYMSIHNCQRVTEEGRAGVYWLLKRCDPKLLSRQVTTSFVIARVHWSSRDAGVGVQLVCHAGHALCHQRKLHLVPKARSMHLHALPHPPCSQVWRILSRSPCQNRSLFLLALGDIFPTRQPGRGVWLAWCDGPIHQHTA
jgi:hypothetical protein